MRSAPCRLLAASLFVFSLTWAGCSHHEPTSSAYEPPPPPPERDTVSRTYDYTHTIDKQKRSRLTRKLVIALVRFAEDRPLGDDDVPYGEDSTEAASPEGGNTSEVAVDIRIETDLTVEPSKQPSGMSERGREMLKRELIETDSFILVERERILDILREQKFGQGRHVNPDTSPELGQVMSVQYLLEGSIGWNLDRTFKDTVEAPPSYKDGEQPTLAERIFGQGKLSQRQRLRELHEYRMAAARKQKIQEENCVAVYLSLYDVRTSEVCVQAFGIGGNALEAIRDAVDDLVDECIELPNPARIAAVDGDRVYLDMGEDDRVAIGQRFRYFTVGRQIRNSAGQLIGTQQEEGGELEILRVDRLMSVGKVTRKVREPVVGASVEPLD